MRILIVGPPRAGNKWLKCLLSQTYRLPMLRRDEIPERPNLDALLEWIAAGRFTDGRIFHQHYHYDPTIVTACAALPATLVTILRNPYDLWRSSFNIQQQGPRQRRDQPTRLYGQAIDSERVLKILRRGAFRGSLENGLGWLESGQSHLIRYEELQADPLAALTRLTNAIAPVPPARLAAVIDFCSADAMRARRPTSVSPGRTTGDGGVSPPLTAAHYEIFRLPQYAGLIERLGYPLR